MIAPVCQWPNLFWTNRPKQVFYKTAKFCGLVWVRIPYPVGTKWIKSVLDQIDQLRFGSFGPN